MTTIKVPGKGKRSRGQLMMDNIMAWTGESCQTLIRISTDTDGLYHRNNLNCYKIDEF